MALQYLSNVSTLTFAEDKCVGCGRCAEVCPHGVFRIVDGKALLVDKDACMECGACALNCPAQALAVQAGVGCAAAIIWGWLTGNEPSCDCDNGSACC